LVGDLATTTSTTRRRLFQAIGLDVFGKKRKEKKRPAMATLAFFGVFGRRRRKSFLFDSQPKEQSLLLLFAKGLLGIRVSSTTFWKEQGKIVCKRMSSSDFLSKAKGDTAALLVFHGVE
jgi:hypothetical protein